MKSSNFTKKFLFILLFSALVLFAACGSSDKEEDTTDSGVVSDEDSAGDAEPSGDTG